MTALQAYAEAIRESRRLGAPVFVRRSYAGGWQLSVNLSVPPAVTREAFMVQPDGSTNKIIVFGTRRFVA